MKIVVLDGYTVNPGDNPWSDLAALGDLTVYDRTPEEALRERAGEAEILLVNKVGLDEAFLESLPRLRFVSLLATGYDGVDVEAAARRGIPVSNVPAYGTDSVAQLVFALLLECCQGVALHDRAVKEGEWASCADFAFWKMPLTELAGKTMGIVGFGSIGRRVGEIAHAFGMEVLAHTPRPGRPPSYAPFAWGSLEEVFARADAVTLHCPQTPDNAGFVNRGLLGLMKPSAFFINTARGGLVVEKDLARALEEGRVAMAAVDVLSREPPEPGNPLLRARNCLVTPHMAWASLEARRRLMAAAVENVRAFLAGAPVNVVNHPELR